MGGGLGMGCWSQIVDIWAERELGEIIGRCQDLGYWIMYGVL